MTEAGIEDPPGYGPPFRTALGVVLFLCLTVFGWGVAARLDSAVIAPGVFVAESERKTVQHFEGGILHRLHVREGDRVEAGQLLAELDTSLTDARLARLESEAWSLRFEAWRLATEARGAERLGPSGAPKGAPEAVAEGLSEAQRQLFRARLGAYEGARRALEREIDRLRADGRAASAQIEATRRTLALLREERSMIAQLVEKGSAPRQRLIEFDRLVSEVEGDLGEHRGRAAAADAAIARSSAELETLAQERLSSVGERATEVERRLDALNAEIAAAKNVRGRQRLLAPEAGAVVDIRAVTPGAVLAPGAPLLDIVPADDRLVAEVQLPPDSIDTVYPGRPADLILTAYKRSDAPIAEGVVSFVSADLLTDEKSGARYFEARIELDENALEHRPDVAITPGMPVEVVIRTGERRAIDYFIEPFVRGARRALHEE